jgi:ASC-1-like (ASCH) protein
MRMNKEHHLKILPEYYNAVRYGAKTFEIRKDDRNYEVGDTLILKEYENDSFTGNLIRAVVTYITDYAQTDDYIVMAIELED